MIDRIGSSAFWLGSRRQVDRFRTSLDDQRCQVVDLHIAQRVVRRRSYSVRFDDIPDQRTLLPRQPNAPEWTPYPQIVLLFRQSVRENNLFVLVLKKHTVARPLRQIFGSCLECPIPVRRFAAVPDTHMRPAQEPICSWRQLLARGAAKQFKIELRDSG